MGGTGPQLAQRLRKYTSGTFAGIFSQQSNIDINNPMVVFNIRDLEDELRPVAMYIVLNYIWNKTKTDQKRRMLIVDEAWQLMKYEDSANFMFSLAKRARKYNLGITTITQDVEDFMGSRMGRAIVANASMQFLLKQSPSAVDVLTDVFKLTSEEKKTPQPIPGRAGPVLRRPEPRPHPGRRQPDRNQPDHHQSRARSNRSTPRPKPVSPAAGQPQAGELNQPQGTIDLGNRLYPGSAGVQK